MFLSPFVITINFIGSLCSILLMLVLIICLGIAVSKKYKKIRAKSNSSVRRKK